MTSPDGGAEPAPWPPKAGRLPYGGIPGEQQLVARAKSGDGAALEELCSAHWAGIYAMIEASVKNPVEAEELTQEVFERAIRSLPSFEYTGAPFSAYLTRIARNLVHDRWRSESRKALVRTEWPGMEIPDARTPEDSVVSKSEQELLRRALRTLSQSHRLVLYLRIVEGLSAQETADRMGRQSDAIRQLQHRALEALRAEMNRIDRQ